MYPGDQAAEIRDLNPIGEGYLCPILVFCELTNSRSKLTPASRAGYHFVSGRISLCKSKRYFGSHAGTRGLIKLSDMDVKMSIEDKQRICIAWYWMKENHPLIKDLDIEEPSDLTNATETLLEEADMTEQSVDMTRLGACHMGPVGTGGPTTADESNNLGNLTIGLLGRDQKVVKYSNPCLLGYLFPTLYPRGQGFYSLDYDGVKRGNIDQIEVYDGRYGKIAIQKACSIDKKSALTNIYLSNIQKAWVTIGLIETTKLMAVVKSMYSHLRMRGVSPNLMITPMIRKTMMIVLTRSNLQTLSPMMRIRISSLTSVTVKVPYEFD